MRTAEGDRAAGQGERIAPRAGVGDAILHPAAADSRADIEIQELVIVAPGAPSRLRQGRRAYVRVDHGRRQAFQLLPDRQAGPWHPVPAGDMRSEEHTSELQSLMRISYAVFCLKKK